MTLKQRLDALRAKFKGMLKPESSQEEIDSINDSLKEIDEIEKEHSGLVELNAKYKDQIVNMVLTSGSEKKPDDPSETSPKGVQELVKEFEEIQEKENKGGK